MAALENTVLAENRCSFEHPEGDLNVQQPCNPSPVRGDSGGLREKAAQFLKEADKNRRQIEKLEKERTLYVNCRKSGWTDASGELEQYETMLEEKRNAAKINFNKQLLKIHSGVGKFQKELIDVKPSPKLIERLKEIMSEVETSINSLKEEQHLCLEKLLKEERVCRQEISAYEKMIENWSLAVKSDPKLPMATDPKNIFQSRPLNRDLPVEVTAMEVFLQKTGGTYGGWDQYDHQAFLKVWTKHSGKPSYRKEAKLCLPGKTFKEIEQHEDWHQELIFLQDRKREAIQRWKSNKHQERQTGIQRQEEAKRREEEGEPKRREMEAKRREMEAKSQAQQQRAEEETREAGRRLEECRDEKRRKEEEEQRLSEEIHRRRQEKEERRRQFEVNLTIEEQLRLMREEQEEKARREEEQREMDERRTEAAKGFRRFNKRVVSHREPTRLTQPTKGWEE